MIKKLFNVLVLVLAINFLAVAGGVAWLKSQQKLTRALKRQTRGV